jgi:hypothetical protein
VTADTGSEPTLAQVQVEFPQWACTRGINRLYYAKHASTGQQVAGEDPLDLRDQIKAAEARHRYSASCSPPRAQAPPAARPFHAADDETPRPRPFAPSWRHP